MFSFSGAVVSDIQGLYFYFLMLNLLFLRSLEFIAADPLRFQGVLRYMLTKFQCVSGGAIFRFCLNVLFCFILALILQANLDKDDLW